MPFKIYQKPYIPKIWRAHSNPAFIYFGTEAQCNWSDSCKSVQLRRECVLVTGPAIRHWSNGWSNTLYLLEKLLKCLRNYCQILEKAKQKLKRW